MCFLVRSDYGSAFLGDGHCFLFHPAIDVERVPGGYACRGGQRVVGRQRAQSAVLRLAAVGVSLSQVASGTNIPTGDKIRLRKLDVLTAHTAHALLDTGLGRVCPHKTQTEIYGRPHKD